MPATHGALFLHGGPVLSSPGQWAWLRSGLLIAVIAGGIDALSASALAANRADDCARLVEVRLPGAAVLTAQFYEAGNFRTSDGKPLPKQNAFCKVVGRAAPSSDSDIRFEVWLPAKDWNGRLWGVGNPSFAGSISQGALGNRMAKGYAAVATDTGHQTDDDEDARWAVGHPQKVMDFGQRGIHLAAFNAKRIVAAFYGRPPDRAYFAACSTGGTQALMEAQRYPEDYDGIIAGAPLPDITSIYIAAGDWQFKWLADTSHHIPAAKLPAIRFAVETACDEIDDVKDGVIEDPRQCTFDPRMLACSGPETDQCLTSPQLETLHQLYARKVSSTGKTLFYGYAMGAEAGLDDWHFRAGPGTDGLFVDALAFWSGLVFEDAAWDFRTYDIERDGRLADRKLAAVLNADHPDLSRFAARGGKLILYQGWADPGVSPFGTIEYFTQVESTLGAKRASQTVRLFMAPGMGHCYGGDGPSDFGQFSAGGGDPDTNLGAALQRWVEQGVAPERIVATKRKNDRDPTSEVVRTRPLCAYPLVAHYRGTGSSDVASNFDCRMTR